MPHREGRTGRDNMSTRRDSGPTMWTRLPRRLLPAPLPHGGIEGADRLTDGPDPGWCNHGRHVPYRSRGLPLAGCRPVRSGDCRFPHHSAGNHGWCLGCAVRGPGDRGGLDGRHQNHRDRGPGDHSRFTRDTPDGLGRARPSRDRQLAMGGCGRYGRASPPAAHGAAQHQDGGQVGEL